MEAFKQVLAVLPQENGENEVPRFTAISGWPGVGKSAFVSSLAYDADIQATYPDGIYWTAFGQNFSARRSLPPILARWGKQMGIGTVGTTLEAYVHALTSHLQQRRALLIVDDLWSGDDAVPFHHMATEGSTVLFTTRLPEIEELLVSEPQYRFRLPVLTIEDGVQLLTALAPNVVTQHPDASRGLVESLESLPLAWPYAAGKLQRGMEHRTATGRVKRWRQAP